MTIAQGARSQLLHKTQSALGTLATGNYTKLRFNSHDLHLMKGTVEGAEIRADREIQDYRHTTRNVEGPIEVDLVDNDHETLIASMMFNPWDTTLISIGITPQYLSIEDGALDIGRYQMFKDCLVSRGTFKFEPAQVIKASFDLVGTGMTLSAATGGGTAVAPSNTQPYDSMNAAIYDTVEESGAEIANISSIDLTVDNGARPIFAVGQTSAIGIEFGRGKVTGNMTIFYEDANWPNRFLNEIERALVINVTDPTGNALEFRMDRIKVGGANIGVKNEQSRLITIPFVALRPTSSSALVISKA